MRHANIRRIPIIFAAMAALVLAIAGFALLHYQAEAQDSSAPARPRGLEATATHDSVTLTWDDPQDDSITGYVVLRRNRDTDAKGHFDELAANTGSAATTYTDGSVAAETRYTYRIKAINQYGTSERSRWFHIDIPEEPEPAANSPATGAPAITGTAQVQETLTADTSGIADEDGLENAAFSYQWLADGTAISGATASAYTPAEADEGKPVTVQVNFTDDAGNDETLTSAPTAAVAAAQPTEPPAKPTNLSATATHNQVVLTWKDPNDDSITGYMILRRVRVKDQGADFSVLVADTGTAALTYTDGSVAAETRYTYRTKAINGRGMSERSRWYHITTPAAPEAAEGDEQDGEGSSAPGKKANVSEPDGEDCTATIATTCEVDVGGSVTGNIETAGDADWFKVVLEADKTYQIDLEGADTGRGTLVDPTIAYLASTVGNQILSTGGSDNGVGKNDRTIYTPAADAAYYVSVSSNTTAVGTYTLSVIVLGANGNSEADADFTDDDTTDGWVDIGASVTGNIESAPGNIESATDTDYDGFRVDLEAGKTYQFDLEGSSTDRGTLPNPELSLFGVSGNALLGDDDSGTDFNSRIAYTATETGAHYLVATHSDENQVTGTYTLSVRDTTPSSDDCPADNTTTCEVNVGGSATGNIDPAGDRDWFRVDLEVDKTYQIDLKGEGGGVGTLTDPSLGNIRDSSGTEIADTGNDDADPDNDIYDSQIIHTPTTAGTYYLVAAGASGTGTYTLSVLGPSDAEQRPEEQQGIQGAFRLNPTMQADYEDQAQDRYSGKQSRLEVFHSNRWGTVCSDRFKGSDNTSHPSHGNLAPKLACQAMSYDDGEYLPGYGSSEAHQSEADRDNYVRPGGTYPASGPLPIWLDDVMCWTRADWPFTNDPTPDYGRLKHLENPEDPENQTTTPYLCAYAGWGLHNGTHQEDAGLRCWYDSQQSAQQAGKSLTVQMSSAPARHDGSHPVRMKITFSEPVDETSETLQEHSIQVDGGEVSAVQPENSQTTPGARSVGNEAQNKVVWIVDIRPNTTEEMTIKLEGRLPCEEAEAICTADGRSLSEGVSTTVLGPSSLPTEPPARPTGLIGEATHDSISLIWDDPSDSSITGYVILRRLPGVDPEGQFNELVANTQTAATTYTDASVSAETRYTYRIKAINEAETSERSRWLHIDTPAAPASRQNSEEGAPGPTTTEPMNGDFAASTETTAQVAVGQSIVGRISTAGDVDWILVGADPGQWFTIALTGYGEGDHTALETPYQQAYHLPDGSVMSPEYALNKGRPPCSAGCTHIVVSQGGSRYVAVASRTDGNTGSYQLTVTLERANEGADMAADVGTRGFLRMLTKDEFPGFNPAWNRVMGQVTPGDADWYRIDLEAGRAYQFGLRQSNTDLRLRLQDSTGTVIDSIRSGRTIHAAACAEGSHYIEVYRPDDAALATTNYVVQAAYTDGLETAALRSILLNAGQVQLDWQCYGIADSHQVQFRLDGRWTTLSADDNNPADIQLDYLNGGHTGKTAGLPTGDEYADYEFRIARVVDGVATTDYREVSVVVIPDTPGNLRGGWDIRYYPDALTFEWNAVKGNNVFYEVQVKDQEDEEWIDLEKGAEPPTGLIYQQAGKTRVKILAASPRYVSDARLWETGNEHVTVRVRANQYDKVSPWSRAFDVLLAEMLWVAAGSRDGAMTGTGQATLTWSTPYYYGPGAFRPTTTHVMYRMDGEWLHLLPGHDVNGVTVHVGSNHAVVSGLPPGLQEYKFSIRHLGRHVPNSGTSLLILSAWSRTITITTDLATPARPEATQTDDNQVSVNWQPVADATQYRLRLWTVNRWEELDGEDDGGVSVTMSGTTAIVSGLPVDYHWYIFEVQALGPNGVQQSGWSPNIAVFNQHRPGG